VSTKKKFMILVGISCFLVFLFFIYTFNFYRSKHVAMVTVSTSNRIVFSKYTINSFKKYAQRWNYDFYHHSLKLDSSRPAAWSKIRAVLDLLKDDRYEWVVWFDDDIFITNPEIKLEELIEKYGKNVDLILSSHKVNPSLCNDINSGLFLVKNTQWSKEFFNKVWDIGNHRYNQESGSFWEQSAIMDLLSKNGEYYNSSHINMVPARKIQSYITLLFKDDKGDYGQWKPGDFVAHLPAAHNEIRASIFKSFTENTYEYPPIPFNLDKNFTIKQ